MKKFKELAGNLGVILITVAVMAGVIGLVYLDVLAYQERFPNAGLWTYFFQNR
jgi:hypothetical protein